VVAEQHRQGALGEQQLFDRVEDVLPFEDRADAVERRGQVDEVKFFEDGSVGRPARTESGREGPGQGVRLPQDVVRDPDVG
jgi:hypothetical protein